MVVTLEAGNLGMEMCISITSQESAFAMVAGLLLSPLVHSCSVACQRKGSNEFSASISTEPGHSVSTLLHPSASFPLSRCCVREAGHAEHFPPRK